MGSMSGGKGQQPPQMGGGAGPAINMATGSGAGGTSYADSLKQQFAQNPTAAYARFGYGNGGAGQQNQGAVRDAVFGGNQEAMNQWINDTEYGNDLKALRNDPAAYAAAMQFGGSPAAPGAAAVPGATTSPVPGAATPAAPGAPVAAPDPLNPAAPVRKGIRAGWNAPRVDPAMQVDGQGGYLGGPGNNQGLIGALMGGGGPRTRPWEFGGGSQQAPWKDPNSRIDPRLLDMATTNGPASLGMNQGVQDFSTAGGQRGASWMGTEQPGLTPGAGPVPQAGANNPIADMLYRQNRGNMDMRRGNPKGAAPPSMYGPGSSAQAQGGKGRGLPGMQPTTM